MNKSSDRKKANAHDNVFISPLSVSMALGMTLNGANGANGATFEAMQNTLAFESMTMEEINQSYRSLIDLLIQLDPKVQFEIANSIWHRQEMSFEPAFLDLNRTYFDAVVRGLDFGDPGAKDIINAWVNEKTHERIDKIIDQINPDHVMFLINAIYFKGAWKYRFDPEQTKDDWFTTSEGSQVAIKMMSLKGDLDLFATDKFAAVDLRYGDAGFRMAVLLPHPQVNVDEVIAELSQENWSALAASFSQQTLNLFLPKFTLQFESTLNDMLAALGMGIAFTEQADFTRMYRPGNLAISEVKHKTFVEVNEEGTEAAAVTSVGVIVTSFPPSEMFFRVDRPFVYVIHEHNSRAILFIGKMERPE